MFVFLNNFYRLQRIFLNVMIFLFIVFSGILLGFDLIQINGYALLGVLFVSICLFFVNFFMIFAKSVNQHTIQVQHALLENIPKGIMITNQNGIIEYVNNHFERITLFSKKEAIGKNAKLLKSGHHDKEFYEKLWNKIQNEGSFNGEIFNRKKNGEIYPQSVSITALYDNDAIRAYITIFSDITEEKEILENLKKQKESFEKRADMDYLTKIYNRSKFDNILEYEYKQYSRYKESFCLFFIDIDLFKNVNDTYGHDVGDVILVELSQLISSNIRAADTFARWGGEEFVLLLPQTTLKDARRIGRNLKNEVETFKFETVEHITISIGLVEFSEKYTLESFIKAADDALYKAKKNGRNRMEIAK